MNRLQRELISRIAMIVLAILLIAGGAGVIYVSILLIRASTHSARGSGSVSGRLMLFGIALLIAGIYFLIMAFKRSVNTDREPTDPRYRIK